MKRFLILALLMLSGCAAQGGIDWNSILIGLAHSSSQPSFSQAYSPSYQITPNGDASTGYTVSSSNGAVADCVPIGDPSLGYSCN